MKNLLWLIVMVFIVNCTNPKTNDEYLNNLKFFGDSLIDHFPKKESILNSHHTQIIDTSAYNNTVEYSLTLFDAKKRIDSILNITTIKFPHVYKASDTCLLVVNDFIKESNIGDPFRAAKSTYIEGCSNDYLPVPNFWFEDYATEETRCKLPKDYLIYVLDSKVGIYSKKINIEQSSMPEEIRHGYSKGFAISKEKNTIMYWVIVW